MGLLPSPTPSLASTPVSKVEEAINEVAGVQQQQSPQPVPRAATGKTQATHQPRRSCHSSPGWARRPTCRGPVTGAGRQHGQPRLAALAWLRAAAEMQHARKHSRTSNATWAQPGVGEQFLPCSRAGSPTPAGLGRLETFKVSVTPAGLLFPGCHRTPSAVGTSTWQVGRRE